MKLYIKYICAAVAMAPTFAFSDSVNVTGNIVTTGNGTYVYASNGSVQAAQFMATSGYITAGSYISAGGYVASSSYVTAPQIYSNGYLRIGSGSSASSNSKSAAIGEAAVSTAYSCLVVGRYNVNKAKDGTTVPSASTWSNNDPVFEVGNGASAAATNNAFSVYKDGSVTLGRFNTTTASDGTATSGTVWADKDPLLLLGNGTDTNNRKNAFAVYKDGTITMSKAQGDISMGQFGN